MVRDPGRVGRRLEAVTAEPGACSCPSSELKSSMKIIPRGMYIKTMELRPSLSSGSFMASGLQALRGQSHSPFQGTIPESGLKARFIQGQGGGGKEDGWDPSRSVPGYAEFLSSVCVGVDGALPAEQVLPASLERMPPCP